MQAIEPDWTVAERSSITDLCSIYAEMAGSDINAVANDEDGIRTMRDPLYHPNDIIEALVVEVRRLRTILRKRKVDSGDADE